MAIKKKKMEVIISESDYLFFQGISVISESLKLDHYLKEAERCLSHIESLVIYKEEKSRITKARNLKNQQTLNC